MMHVVCMYHSFKILAALSRAPGNALVNNDVVKSDPSRSFPERGPILCQVRMLNESPLIPDFECLEQMISEESRAA